MPYKDKVVLVTGGGRGIGKVITQMYAQAGAKLVVAELFEASAGDSPDGSLFIRTDVANPDSVDAMIQVLMATYGRIDILINNAGIGVNKSPYLLSVADWDLVLNTNLRGAFLCARAVAFHMRQQAQGGAIVNIASTRALMSEPDSEAYAASKGGLLSLTHALAASLSKDNIRVNCISPGWIETGDYAQLRPEDHAQHISGRVGRPEDIGRACMFLTDPNNDFISGENLVIDGGMTRRMIYEP
jgi:NAD(P)-dependent dehydrogenase (short-subunit alcohol dehydrogenase family)